MSSRTSIRRAGSKPRIVANEAESISQKSDGSGPVPARRSSSKSRLLKQGSSHEVRAASPGSLDDDVPDDVSLTLVEHGLSSGLDSPSKELRNVDLHSKLEPDLPSMELDHRRPSSSKIEPPVIAEPPVDAFKEPPAAVELPIMEFLPVVTPQPSPVKVAQPKETVPLPSLSAAQTQSAKVNTVPARVPAADGKHRSKSMMVSSTTNSSSSLSVEPADKKQSPSEKFRSFMKSFAPSRSLEGVGEDELGDFSADGVSIKGSSSSRKLTPEEEAKRASDLKLRIARVQEEQNKFRMSQKKNLRSSFAAASPTSFREQINANKEKEKLKKLKAVNKNGTAQSFNTFSILAGLKKTEFRATMEVGASFIKHTTRLSEDQFNENSIPITHGQNHLEHHPHRDTVEHPRTVTFHGEGYMSDEDWRITNKSLKNKRQMKTPDAKSAASSQQNLEEVIEASLREQSARSIPVDDCSDTPDVPLAYLQSSTLVEKRFGWETKDHSITPGVVLNRGKSWTALRSAVHGAGAFNIVAAAAAASTPDQEEDLARLKLPLRLMPDPPATAPVIVLEATPVTDFVAKIVHGCQQRSLSQSEDEASVGSAERKLPAFVISKHVPQRKSPEKMLSPLQASMRPSKTVIAKEEMRNAKLLANTKEFHDRYHGLIFHDSSRNLTWQDTEDLILGTGRHHQNNVLNTRSDMRSAGKTMNMFRPWSAARQEDVIDQFLHQHPMSSQPGSRAGSQPSSTKNSPDKPGSPTQTMLHALNLRDSYSPSSDRGAASPTASKRKQDAGSASVTSKGSSTGKGMKSSGSQGSVTFGQVVFNSGKTSAHIHLNDHQSDAGSVFTMNSHLQGSRGSTMTKRAPLLINLVKNLPSS